MHGLLQRTLPRFRPRGEHRPVAQRVPDGPTLRIRWLGTAGHVISTATTTVLLDPFVSRPGLRGLARPLTADTEAIERWVPQQVDAVILGHSHYDHLLDAPAIALKRGARVVGSGTTLAFARSAGVPEHMLELVPPAGRSLVVGDIAVELVPSLHGRIMLGRVPFAGEVGSPPSLPARFWHYRMGGAFGVLLRAAGCTVYHNGSADLVDAELDQVRADVLLVGLAGRWATRDYLARLTSRLGPRLVIPTHHDAFFAPLESGERLLPGIDLNGFFGEMRGLAPRARVVTPLYRDEIVVPLAGDVRDACVVER